MVFDTVKELWKLINIWLSCGQEKGDTDIWLHVQNYLSAYFTQVVQQRLKWCDKYYLGFFATIDLVLFTMVT